jgi:hypothetical protein
VIANNLTRTWSPFRVLSQTHRYGCAAGSPPPESCVPSPHHWESKGRKNKHFAKSMRHHGESGNLQCGTVGTSQAGTFPFLLVVVLSISSSSQVRFDEMEVRHAYSYWRQLIVICEDPACSMACMTSRTNSSSQVTMVMFFMSPADSGLAIKKSWRLCKILCVVSRRKGN